MLRTDRKITTAFIAILLFLFSIGCSNQDQSKIPITTSSRTALKHFIEGRDLSERFRVAEATAHFELALEADSSMAMAYYYNALGRQSVNSFMALYQKALQLVDSVSEGEQLMIRALEANVNSDPVLARQHLEKLVNLYPHDERALSLLGGLLYGQQEYQNAIDQYLLALEIDPKYSQPYNMLGYAYRQIDEYELSEKYFLDYIKLIPDDPNPYDSYAELLLEKGEFENSIEYYKKALAMNPEFIASHIGIASNLVLKEEHARARRQLQKALDIMPNYGDQRRLLFSRAITFVDESRFEDALNEVDRAIDLCKAENANTDLSNDLVIKATLRLETGDINAARNLYLESKDLTENSDLAEQIKENNRYNVLYRLARCDLAEGDISAAKDKAAEMKSWTEKNHNPFQIRLAHQLLGIIAYHEKNYDQALIEFQQADQLNSYNIFRIAQTLEAVGDLEQAAIYYEKAANTNSFLTFNYSYIRKRAKAALHSLQSI